jgi:diguanylate cyclase (GGDEF)-like protein/PAS domain S-box-containing protein
MKTEPCIVETPLGSRVEDSHTDVIATHALLTAAERIAHVGGWQWDTVRDVLVWSDETYRMLGRDPQTCVPSIASFLALVHPGDRTRMQAAINETLVNHEPFEIEFRVNHPDQTTRTIHARGEVSVDARGRVTRITGTNHDITERKQVDAARAAAEALYRNLFESSPDGILVVGSNRQIVSFNQKFLDLWRIPSDIAQSRSDERAVASVLDRLKDPDAFLARLLDLYADPEVRADEEIALKDGRVFERHTAPLPLSEGEPPGRIFFFRDITARKTAEDRVAHMAEHDVLTGLANRRVFVDSVQQAIARTQRGAKGFAVLYLDLDHFKDINDTLGHPIGDQLLKEVARRLRETIRVTDRVARFGGDEFAILQSDIVEPTEVVILTERLQSVLRAPFVIQGNQIQAGASIGLTLNLQEGADAETLLSQADLALYRAKAEGRGTYRFFATSMDEEVRARVTLACDLREGLERGELFLAYQPQVEIASGRIVGLEALARWNHPRRGAISPGEFIPVAEKSGLIPSLGRWAMREACRQAKAWLDANIAPPVVAVNVSALQFKTPCELETMVSSILAETGLPAERLEVELTESALMEAWSKQSDVLARLRQSGVRIAIDDFGTGFSSLEYLSRFPVDRIKIAQTFVMDLASRPTNAAIVKATLGLARELGLQVIAEGVETEAQLTLLKGWGCREVQGYLFSKPLPSEAITALLREGAVAPKSATAYVIGPHRAAQATSIEPSVRRPSDSKICSDLTPAP